MVVPSGQVVSLERIAADPHAFIDQSVRVKGALKSYDPSCNLAVFQMNNATLQIDTEYLESFPFGLDCMVECIGEIRKGQSSVFLKARTARSIDAVDQQLYDKVMELQTRYIEETYGPRK